jgi:hypothetical protein
MRDQVGVLLYPSISALAARQRSDLDPQQEVAGSIPATLTRPDAVRFWLAVLLTGAGAERLFIA